MAVNVATRQRNTLKRKTRARVPHNTGSILSGFKPLTEVAEEFGFNLHTLTYRITREIERAENSAKNGKITDLPFRKAERRWFVGPEFIAQCRRDAAILRKVKDGELIPLKNVHGKIEEDMRARGGKIKQGLIKANTLRTWRSDLRLYDGDVKAMGEVFITPEVYGSLLGVAIHRYMTTIRRSDALRLMGKEERALDAMKRWQSEGLLTHVSHPDHDVVKKRRDHFLSAATVGRIAEFETTHMKIAEVERRIGVRAERLRPYGKPGVLPVKKHPLGERAYLDRRYFIPNEFVRILKEKMRGKPQTNLLVLIKAAKKEYERRGQYSITQNEALGLLGDERKYDLMLWVRSGKIEPVESPFGDKSYKGIVWLDRAEIEELARGKKEAPNAGLERWRHIGAFYRKLRGEGVAAIAGKYGVSYRNRQAKLGQLAKTIETYPANSPGRNPFVRLRTTIYESLKEEQRLKRAAA